MFKICLIGQQHAGNCPGEKLNVRKGDSLNSPDKFQAIGIITLFHRCRSCTEKSHVLPQRTRERGINPASVIWLRRLCFQPLHCAASKRAERQDLVSSGHVAAGGLLAPTHLSHILLNFIYKRNQIVFLHGRLTSLVHNHIPHLVATCGGILLILLLSQQIV